MNEISIHALLAESDVMHALIFTDPVLFLSTLSLRRATRFRSWLIPRNRISIHALLAESDIFGHYEYITAAISIHALLAESDLDYKGICVQNSEFLSTLSLRRATRRM